MTQEKQELKTYYVAHKLIKWQDVKFEANHPLPFPVEFQVPNNGEIGMLPVFDSMEKALEYANGAGVTPIQELAISKLLEDKNQ